MWERKSKKETERGRKREGERERDRESEREGICIYFRLSAM